MIQFPVYTQVNPYQQNSSFYLPQASNPYQTGNVFYPAHVSNLPQSLGSIHKIYYPDLTNEEFNASESVRNEMLYKSGKLEQLAKYGCWTNCGLIYNAIKNNNDFKELINSKYLNDSKGFVLIMKNLNSLENQRQKNLTYYPPMYGINIQQVPLINYSQYNINDYLRMLNNFTKNNKISDDLKKYFLYKESDKLDLYYTKLNILDNIENPLDILIK